MRAQQQTDEGNPIKSLELLQNESNILKLQYKRCQLKILKMIKKTLLSIVFLSCYSQLH